MHALRFTTALKSVLLFVFLPLISFGQNPSESPEKSIVHTFSETLLYPTAHSDLTVGHTKSLDMILDSIGDAENYSITIVGHTDDVGSESFNQKLSQRRAQAVEQYLLDHGAKSDFITTSYKGEGQPIKPNTDDHGRMVNRRVEVTTHITLHLEKAIIKHEEKPVESIQKLFAKTQQTPQEFCIYANKDTVIKGAQGTVIYIKAGTFMDETNTTDCVTLRLKEFFSKSDMLLENLTTTSNGHPLESAGMIYIEAVKDGKNYNVRPGKDLIISTPSDSYFPGALIFSGDSNAHDSIMNWTVNNNSLLNNLPMDQLIPCGGVISDGTTRCPFFFCKINRFFSGLFGSNTSTPTPARTNSNSDVLIQTRFNCEDLDSLFNEYGVTDVEALIDAMNAELYEKYGVDNLWDLNRALKAEKIENIEASFGKRTIPLNDLSYYIYNTRDLGWINCDAFMDVSRWNKTVVSINEKPSQNIDVKLVFKDNRTVLPATDVDGKITFQGVPKDYEAWIVAIKYVDGSPLLALKEITIAKETHQLEFEELTLNQLNEKLTVLDQ
jgi:hypothetical protein